MKTSLLLLALATLTLTTPATLATAGDATSDATTLDCAPDPRLSPLSDMGCCVFNTLRVRECILD